MNGIENLFYDMPDKTKKAKKGDNEVFNRMMCFYKTDLIVKEFGDISNTFDYLRNHTNTMYLFNGYYLINYENTIYFIKIEKIETKEKDEEMEDLDFQVGDKVYDLRYGNGIMDFFQKDNLMVHFLGESSVNQRYNKQGVLFPRITEMKRTLYHGHDLEVTIKEKKPERFKWINIIYDPTRNNHVSTPTIHNSKEIALKEMRKCVKEPCIYVDTIQLIPNHLKEK